MAGLFDIIDRQSKMSFFTQPIEIIVAIKRQNPINRHHSLSHPTKFQPLRWKFCLPASCEVSPASCVRLPQVITALMLLQILIFGGQRDLRLVI
ncbi:hypothetical protein Peur_042365 [Populus x canadensis]